MPARFSIVIPAMNRQSTLDYTIKTIQASDYDDYEVILHDGASDPPLTGYPNVKLFRTDEDNSMSSDWNTALSKATGEYVIVFGCDDGILPHALTDIDSILTEMNNPPLIRWRRIYYTWKDDSFFAQHSAELQISINGSSRMLDSKKLISAVAQHKMDYTYLPMLYTSAIRRDLLETLIERTGNVCTAISPDIYSGFALASLVDKVPSIGKATTINASSRWSTGVNNFCISESDITKNFVRNNEREGLTLDARLPSSDYYTMKGAILDSFYKACDNGLTDVGLLNTPVSNIPEFDGQVIIKRADNVFDASVIAGEMLKDVKYSLDFKEW